MKHTIFILLDATDRQYQGWNKKNKTIVISKPKTFIWQFSDSKFHVYNVVL